jgi:hypothetical protein
MHSADALAIDGVHEFNTGFSNLLWTVDSPIPHTYTLSLSLSLPVQKYVIFADMYIASYVAMCL